MTFLLSLFLGIAQFSHDAFAKPPFVIHKRSSNFIDIEADRDRVWWGCSEITGTGNSVLIFYVLGTDGESHEFFLRRVDSPALCQSRAKTFQMMAGASPTIRIVGIHGFLEKGPQKPLSPGIPEKFTATSKIIHWTFQRMQAGKKCEAYFEHHCDLPKNYWTDTIPF